MRRFSPLLALLVFLLVTNACGRAPAHTAHPVVIGPLSVYLPPDMDEREAALVCSAVSTHLAAFEAEFGYVTPAQKVSVVDTTFMECGYPLRLGFDGGCNYMNGSIMVWKGAYDEVPGLYHELAHCYLDPNHEGSIWAEVNRRMNEIAHEIAHERGGP